MANSKLRVTELDFNNIKENLKNYLRDRPEFTDYDFEGAALTVLLDVLAYNTHYNAYYLNVVGNEAFLDSAQLRESVISRAKEIGYTPRSWIAATALLDIKAVPKKPLNPPYDTLSFVVLDKNKPFTTVIDGNTYTFVTQASHVLTKNLDGDFVGTNIPVKQGKYLEFRYVVDKTNPEQKFIIPNERCDTTTLRVLVQTSATDTTTEAFSPVIDFNELTPDTNCYWIHEIANGLYEVQFGDGVLGKALADGNIIKLSYMVTEGDVANKASEFTYTSSIQGLTNIQVTTVQAAYGGAEIESIDSIKFTAPKYYQAQNRAVTPEDYEVIVKREFPNIDSVTVWGGEDNDPPIYGKVFISVKPADGFTLTLGLKQLIADEILREFNVVTILPEVVDPEYLFVIMDTEVRFDSFLTNKTAEDIRAEVVTTIDTYNEDRLGKFDKKLRFSQLVADIDDTDQSILNNQTHLFLQKRFIPAINLPFDYTLRFQNELEPNSLAMDGFTINDSIVAEAGTTYFMKDNGGGIMVIYRNQPISGISVVGNIGTVDYVTGKVFISQFKPATITDSFGELRMTATPLEEDISVLRNTIVEIDMDELVVTVVPEYRAEI
ncbi:MAG: hypothetical protein BV459_00575 [Thermoplasmata archaeon M11B2D]|nr:MAG: hypothetical protein BV459_00575 [Thermoplasmata archaeon M11B2D]